MGRRRPLPPPSSQVAAQHRPIIHRVLAYEDELFALLTALLDATSLASSSATFADTLYGLRRAPLTPGGAVTRRPLSGRERRRTLAFLVLAPYARAKLDAVVAAHTRPGPGGARVLTLTPAPVDAPPLSALARVRRAAVRAAVAAHPSVVAAVEGLRFVYQTAYLLDTRVGGGAQGRSDTASPTPSPPPPRFFSPGHALLRQVTLRVSGPELFDADALKWSARRDATAGAGALARASARFRWAVADHARSALILAVFGFKALEWWYASGEAALGGRKPLPPPPPPPPPLPHSLGVAVPEDPGLCPLCVQPRTNPALAVASGHVFCYPCLTAHVRAHGCCPVTRVATGLDGVRRLYQSG
jgi:peroxin-12